MNFVIACGGTAGHIYPGIAIADIIRGDFPDAEITFIGTPNGMESKLIKDAGFPMIPIRMQGLKRKFSLSNLKTLRLLLASEKKAAEVLRQLTPVLVIGTGGYVCYPVLRAAQKMKIKCAVHESNAMPGLSVRLLARKTDRIWVGYEAAAKRLGVPSKTAVTGNPLRRSFHDTAREKARAHYGFGKKDFVVLSFGGSQGAQKLNDTMTALLCDELPLYIRLVHICGNEHFSSFSSLSFNRRHRLFPYLSEMPTMMKASDLVICRCGAMTLSEIAFLRRPAILVPSPYVSGNHQYYNALVFAEKEAGILLSENDFTVAKVKNEILRLYHNTPEREHIQRNLSAFAALPTKEMIAQEIHALIE